MTGSPYFAAHYRYCPQHNTPRHVYQNDTLIIYRTGGLNSAYCPKPDPDRTEPQTPGSGQGCPRPSSTGAVPASGPSRLRSNPVDCSDGRKVQDETDYRSADFAWRRGFDGRGLPAEMDWRFAVPRLSVSQTLIYDVAVFTYGPWRRAFIRQTGQTNWTSNRSDDGKLEVVSGANVFREASGRRYTFDGQGLAILITEPDGRQTSISRLSGNAWGGDTEQWQSASGRSYAVAMDPLGRIRAFTDAAGQTTRYHWDALGRLASVTHPDDTPEDPDDNPVRTYLYENEPTPRALTGILDENGDRYATYAYDAQGRVTLSEHAGGAGRTTFEYLSPTSTRVRTYQDATRYTDELVTHAVFGTQGSRITAIGYGACPDCGLTNSTESYTYNSTGGLSSHTDRRGLVTTYSTSNNRENSRTEASGTPLARTISTSWNTTWDTPYQITEPGRTTRYYYNSLGQLTEYRVLGTATRSTTYTYHAGNQRLATINGPRTDVSDISSFAYDGQGNLIQVTNALGQITSITDHDAHGNPLRIVDANGVETLLAYDARQRLKTRTTAGETTSFEYDKVGQLRKVTTPDGAWLAYTYDAAHRLTGIADPDGNRIAYTLDWAGNRTAEAVYDPSNTLRRSQARLYDGLNRLRQIQGGNGQLTQLGYDDNHNLSSTTVDGSQVTTRGYDALDRLIQVTDPGSGVTQYAYNPRDELTSVTDPRGLVTAYTLNANGDLTQLQSPDTGTSTATYDSAGNLKTRTDAKGQVVTYSYDALNRVTQAVYTGGPTITYSYDQGTYGKGRLTGISRPGASLNWTYTAQGRVASQTQVVGARTLVTSYGYDPQGRLATQILPSGKVVGYAWNLNRLTGMAVDGNPVASNLQQEPFGGTRQWDFANGQQVQKSFDLSGRLTAHSLGTVGYDTADRITGLAHGSLSQLTGSKTYGYDSLDRLTGYLGASFSIGYGYDANGNRSQQSGTAGTTDYTTSLTSNRLDSLTVGGATQSFTYDANGSLLNDGSHTYGYDKTGRLVSVDATAYAYNGLGQRVSKTVSGSGTVYAYDEAGHLVGEYDAATGTAIQETVWMGDTPIAVVKGSGTYYVHADHLNTPRQINDASGDPVWVWDTITFGSSSPDEDPLSTGISFTYNLRHPGQVFDAESGLFQNWHRDYHPALGRYVQSDPIGLAGGLNTYQYSAANPIEFSDPAGLTPLAATRNGWAIGSSIGRGINSQVEAVTGLPIGVHIYNSIHPEDSQSCPTADTGALKKRVCRNPNGCNGREDHQRKVRDLTQQALDEAEEGEQVLQNRKIQGYDSRRKPDVQLVDRQGRARKILEAERHPNSLRSRNRSAEYDDLGIPHETYPLD
ncbi:RHS repeat-associated core domain-containing protein [Solimonas sp. SE-A11]|uniref:RHS repeat-associated core domain-containing protein n=1 Tax=Solimonas sp. SE-A11 TaxID=3054954 RepID=UPI00259CC23F|nr:RHS repeat-associated core domain-containing protein [Solimonas sp. SE-A11]MDM4769257.1 RHS repeat-associated core domain-containing protein [Solimonas sp. SE-A11]